MNIGQYRIKWRGFKRTFSKFGLNPFWFYKVASGFKHISEYEGEVFTSEDVDFSYLVFVRKLEA